jgi:hypothetical protein
MSLSFLTHNNGSRFDKGQWVDHIEVRQGTDKYLVIVNPDKKSARDVYALKLANVKGRILPRKERLQDHDLVSNIIKAALGSYK